MWWAQKEFMRGKTLQDYVGKNEKTKIITKIQKVCRIGFQFFTKNRYICVFRMSTACQFIELF